MQQRELSREFIQTTNHIIFPFPEDIFDLDKNKSHEREIPIGENINYELFINKKLSDKNLKKLIDDQLSYWRKLSDILRENDSIEKTHLIEEMGILAIDAENKKITVNLDQYIYWMQGTKPRSERLFDESELGGEKKIDDESADVDIETIDEEPISTHIPNDNETILDIPLESKQEKESIIDIDTLSNARGKRKFRAMEERDKKSDSSEEEEPRAKLPISLRRKKSKASESEIEEQKQIVEPPKSKRVTKPEIKKTQTSAFFKKRSSQKPSSQKPILELPEERSMRALAQSKYNDKLTKPIRDFQQAYKIAKEFTRTNLRRIKPKEADRISENYMVVPGNVPELEKLVTSGGYETDGNNERFYFVLIDKNKNVIGDLVFTYNKKENLITIPALEVDVTLKGQGLGALLVLHVLDFAAKHNVPIIKLETGEHEKAKAMKEAFVISMRIFYIKLGFRLESHASEDWYRREQNSKLAEFKEEHDKCIFEMDNPECRKIVFSETAKLIAAYNIKDSIYAIVKQHCDNLNTDLPEKNQYTMYDLLDYERYSKWLQQELGFLDPNTLFNTLKMINNAAKAPIEAATGDPAPKRKNFDELDRALDSVEKTQSLQRDSSMQH